MEYHRELRDPRRQRGRATAVRSRELAIRSRLVEARVWSVAQLSHRERVSVLYIINGSLETGLEVGALHAHSLVLRTKRLTHGYFYLLARYCCGLQEVEIAHVREATSCKRPQ